jgi:hypothetical protein
MMTSALLTPAQDPDTLIGDTIMRDLDMPLHGLKRLLARIFLGVQ